MLFLGPRRVTRMIPARILGTGSALPSRIIDNQFLIDHAGLPSTPAEVEARCGIRTRRWLGDGESAISQAILALRAALDAAGLQPRDLRRLIFTTSMGGDMLVPANANAVLDALGAGSGTCDGFDLNNSCVGFVTALDVAARCAATGLHPVAVVCSEATSRYVTPDDARPYLIMADAAAAAIVGPGDGSGGLRSSVLANEAIHWRSMTLDHPALAGGPTFLKFHEPNKRIAEVATAAIVGASRRAVEQAGLTMADIDWVAPHQPNGRLLPVIVQQLGLDPSRLVSLVGEVGSVGSASVPLGLDALLRSGRVRPGDRVLMCAVGTGVACGALVWEIGR